MRYLLKASSCKSLSIQEISSRKCRYTEKIRILLQKKNLLIVSGVPCVRKKNQNLINFGNAQNDLITFIPSSQRQEGYVARFL